MRPTPVCFYSLMLLFTLFVASCSDVVTAPSDTPDYAVLADRLEEAYDEQSQALLDRFFEDWADMLPAHSSRSVNAFSDTVRQAYDIFQAFYSPTDLERLTHGDHENFETDFRYIVAQNSIDVAVVDTNPKFYFHRGVEAVEKHIDDFRPPLQGLPYPVVYLSARADSVLYDFLYREAATHRSDHQARVEFLREAIQLTHHHWISDYHKATMPVASHIYLDESLSTALVQFRVFYQFGTAYFERRDGSWTLVSSELSGIE